MYINKKTKGNYKKETYFLGKIFKEFITLSQRQNKTKKFMATISYMKCNFIYCEILFIERNSFNISYDKII